MKITVENGRDNVGEIKLINFVKQTIEGGCIHSTDQLHNIVNDYIKAEDSRFVHGHRCSDYFEVTSAWNELKIHHLNSKAEKDRLILKIEL